MLCEIALVLLLDASASVMDPEWREQTFHTAEAFRTEEVVHAIVRTGSVAVMAAGFSDTTATMIGWRVLRTQADAERFAADLIETRRPFRGGTQIGDAIQFGIRQIQNSPCTEIGQAVIDVSTDGDAPETDTQLGRDAAQLAGIRVNAIAVGAAARSESLRDNAVTYDGFLLEANSWAEYPHMLRRKIVMELGSLPQ